MGNEQIFILADRLKELKDRKKDLEEEKKAVNAEIEEIDRMLSDLMANAEVSKFSRNGSTFYLTTKLMASPISGQRDELFAALRAHGYGDLVIETVNANSLNSFCREQIEQSGEAECLPEWLSEVVSTYEKTSVGVRKG